MSLYNDKEFENLFRNNYINLCNYAAKFINDTQIAEDIVQDFFINIWEKKHLHITIDNFWPYACRAVKNSCINYFKRNSLKENYFNTLAQEWEEEVTAKEEENPHSRKILDAVNKLPPKSKEVFLSKYASDLNYKEISEIFDISVNTVKYHIKEAYKLIRKELKVLCLLFFLN